MADPFKIDGPTCLSFSMGRSSGTLLERVLALNPIEVLREHLAVLTCNTGKEDEASLRFGHRIDMEWLAPLGMHRFDLQLPNNNGKTMHGNCDLCMLKPAHQVFSLIAEKPERAVWWAKQEATARATGDGRFFRNDRPSYAEMAKYAAEQRDIFNHDEEAISCLCGD